MMLYTISILPVLFSISWGSRIIIPHKPEYVGCKFMQKHCKKIPAHQICIKTYIPEGKCCPVCACANEQGYQFSAPEAYTVHKGGCAVCTCKVIDGVAQSVCHHAYCPRLKCPASIQEAVQGSCCKRCPTGYVRTFPPRPTFPPFPGFPPKGFPPKGFPPRGFPPPPGRDEPLNDEEFDDEEREYDDNEVEEK
eukprot:Seg2666.3 transcript_id=Seg2666.3/GoldUCD/mRNA.D3Y31 product="hypothetical protein" protein_id=Seg2666.3/GoldUCD/D3Y31